MVQMKTCTREQVIWERAPPPEYNVLWDAERAKVEEKEGGNLRGGGEGKETVAWARHRVCLFRDLREGRKKTPHLVCWAPDFLVHFGHREIQADDLVVHQKLKETGGRGGGETQRGGERGSQFKNGEGPLLFGKQAPLPKAQKATRGSRTDRQREKKPGFISEGGSAQNPGPLPGLESVATPPGLVPLARPPHLHPAVVFQQSHQVAVLTDLVLDVPHQRPDARLVAAVGVPGHPALQEILLLRVLLQRDKELCHFVLFLREAGSAGVRKKAPSPAPTALRCHQWLTVAKSPRPCCPLPFTGP